MFVHQAVLLREVIRYLNIKPDGIYLDCTFGRGGHSREIVQRLSDSGRLLAFDRDIEAVTSDEAKALLKDQRVSFHHAPFSELTHVIRRNGYEGKLNGIVMDLGVSSPQLDDAHRGFSFLRDGALDMRMDIGAGMSAAEYLAKVDEKQLAQVIFKFGEERFAKCIAHAIVEGRKRMPLQSTLQLARLIEECVPYRDKNKHPATRTFQAIRIEINQELEQIETGLKQALSVLAPEGRLIVISFHSLEDRIVKRFFRAESGPKMILGKLPVRESDIERGALRIVGKRIRPSPEELQHNPRSRSAIMRVAEKI